MKLGKILFASDYSRTGDLAFALAASIARHAGAELLVVHVEQASNEYGGEHYHGTANPTTDVLRRELERLAPASSQVPCSYHLLAGKPAKAISVYYRSRKGWRGIDSFTVRMNSRGQPPVFFIYNVQVR